MCFLLHIAIPCKQPKFTTKYAQAPTEMKNLYRSGEAVVFGCEPGYRVVGNGTRECNEGNWMITSFNCESKYMSVFLFLIASGNCFKQTSALIL